MLRTFNCGIGMIVVVEGNQAEAVTQVLEAAGERVVRLGTIRARRGGEDQVATRGALVFA